MASNIGDIRAGLPTRIKDDAAKLTFVAGNAAIDPTKDQDAAIFAALEEYQKARPRERAKLVTGSGAFDYAVSGLTGFVDGFSIVTEVVFPWAANTPNPPIMDGDQYAVVRLDGDALFLRFFSAVPGPTQKFLASYTTAHTLSVSASTVSPSDDEALKDLAAAYCCEMLAAYYSQTTDASISADSVNRVAKADSYRAAARRWRESYKAKMSTGESAGPAMAIGNLETGFGTRRDRYFFHGKRP